MAQGKRAGARRKRTFRPTLLLLALAVTVLLVAWGYLVVAAIDFGTAARAGDTTAWWFLGLASLGAVACLFLGLVLVARIARELGITRPSDAGGPPRPSRSRPNHRDTDSPDAAPLAEHPDDGRR